MGMSAAKAQEVDVATKSEATDEDTSRWGIGVAAAVLERPFRDYDNETKVIPIVYFDNRWMSLNGGRFDFKINRSETLSFRARARYSLDGYDPDESDYLEGMEERDDSAWVGGAIVWKPSFAEFSAEYLTDAMDKSGGSRARLEVERRFGMGRFGLTPRLAAEWVDQKYVAYYYGVLPGEVTPDRSFYEGDATANIEAGIRLDYSPSRKHTFFVDVSAVSLGDEIKNSPLVERSSQSRVTAGYLFHF
jgi:outer membrane protein